MCKQHNDAAPALRFIGNVIVTIIVGTIIAGVGLGFILSDLIDKAAP
jgi:hypothetical protein